MRLLEYWLKTIEFKQICRFRGLTLIIDEFHRVTDIAFGTVKKCDHTLKRNGRV